MLYFLPINQKRKTSLAKLSYREILLKKKIYFKDMCILYEWEYIDLFSPHNMVILAFESFQQEQPRLIVLDFFLCLTMFHKERLIKKKKCGLVLYLLSRNWSKIWKFWTPTWSLEIDTLFFSKLLSAVGWSSNNLSFRK